MEQRKITWVNWDTVCLPKDKRGLGIKDLKTFNTALLGRWRWDLVQQHGALWTRVLTSKYGGWRSLDGEISGSHQSPWWKDLMRIQQQGTSKLKKQTAWKVGCGDKIRFWEYCWTSEDVPLMLKYPRLYQISSQQQQLIMQMGRHFDEGWEWNYSWRRPLFDNEVATADEFLRETANLLIHPNKADSWVGKADPSGSYSTKSAYKLLRGDSRGEHQDGAFVELWKIKISAKAAVFAWRLIRDRLPTKSNLRRRQVEVNDMRCPFCNNDDEDAAHLFFHCSQVLPSWWESLSWVNITGAFPQSPKDRFLQHGSGIVHGIKATRWKCWWVALTWTIWQHRNRIVFSNQTFNGSKLSEDAILLIWTWLKTTEKDFGVHFNQWSTNPQKYNIIYIEKYQRY
ncbi:putative ribonuclease H protein [Glycine soja]